jgi:hypothetical protein
VVLVSSVWRQRPGQVGIVLVGGYSSNLVRTLSPYSKRLEPLPNLYTLPLEDGLKESAKHKAEVNKEINK